jgi:hypothetical protein
MPPFYHKALLNFLIVVLAAVATLASVIGIMALSDNLTDHHLGYPWWSVVGCLLMIAVALGIRHLLKLERARIDR